MAARLGPQPPRPWMPPRQAPGPPPGANSVGRFCRSSRRSFSRRGDWWRCGCAGCLALPGEKRRKRDAGDGGAQREGFLRLLGVALAGWLLESIHYALVVEAYHVGAPASLVAKTLGIFVAGLPAMFTRIVFFMGTLWVSAWLFSAKLDGRTCFAASVYGSLALGAAALLLSPLAGHAEPLAYINVVYGAELAAQAWGMYWALRSLYGVEEPRWKLAVAVVTAVVLVGATPAALLTPQAQVYGLVYQAATGRAA